MSITVLEAQYELDELKRRLVNAIHDITAQFPDAQIKLDLESDHVYPIEHIQWNFKLQWAEVFAPELEPDWFPLNSPDLSINDLINILESVTNYEVSANSTTDTPGEQATD